MGAGVIGLIPGAAVDAAGLLLAGTFGAAPGEPAAGLRA